MTDTTLTFQKVAYAVETELKRPR